MKVYTNNISSNNLKDMLEGEQPIERLRVAVPFLTDGKLIEDVLKNSGRVDLVVCLQPPTDYAVLKNIYRHAEVRYFHEHFHSKIYLCTSSRRSVAIIGSSNLTSGGLFRNIETNVLLDDREAHATGVYRQFDSVWKIAEPLTPDVLNQYKKLLDDYRRRIEGLSAGIGGKTRYPGRIGLAAREYLHFWKAADLVLEALQDLPALRFPEYPSYISLDHFWHYLTTAVEAEAVETAVAETGWEAAAVRLFNEYADSNFGREFLASQQNRIRRIRQLLNPERIGHLSLDQAQEVHRNLHCVAEDRRWGHDAKLIAENPIELIRAEWTMLLHDSKPIERRIDHATRESGLRFFGKSSVQELNGWYTPEVYPICNRKALKALGLLRLA